MTGEIGATKMTGDATGAEILRAVTAELCSSPMNYFVTSQRSHRQWAKLLPKASGPKRQDTALVEEWTTWISS